MIPAQPGQTGLVSFDFIVPVPETCRGRGYTKSPED